MNTLANRVDLRFNIILFSLFALVALGGWFGFQQIRQELLNEQLTINAGKTEALVKRIDQWLVTRKTEVSTLANTPVIRSMDWQQAGPFLKAKHEQMPWFYIFAHINPDGTYYNSKVDFAKGQNLSDRAHFKAAIKGEVYASDPVNSRTLDADIVAVTSPIYRSDRKGAEIIGVFGGMIDTGTIVEELKRFSNGPGSYAFALNADGIAIAHPDPRRKGNINTKANSLLQDADAGLKGVAERMLQGTAGYARTVVDAREVYATFEPLTQAKWYVATITDAAFVEKTLQFVDWLGAFALLVLCGTVALVIRFRRLELRTLNQQAEVAEEKSRAKSTFLANMSHELRTPLNGILGYSQIMLQREGRDEASRRYLQIIQSSGQHLLGLINRVLDLSKIEAGRIELEPRPVDLNNMLQDLVRLFDIEKAKHGATFVHQLDPALDRVVVLDPERFRQIVTNVVVNAFKYGNRSEVRLDVTAAEAQDRKAMTVRVRDSGRGMTPEQVARAFVPFEQVNRGAEGAGLGLAIVNELVRLMDGNIAIDSAPGQGTTVSITIPYDVAGDDMVQTLTGAQGMPQGIRGGLRPRILVVDDNPVNVDFLVDLLQMIGFQVRGCHGVDAALVAFATSEVDLIITDLVMPERDGFDLIKAIRSGSRAPSTPIIVASASAFAGDQVRAMAIGANEFMPKPVDSAVLLQKMAALLKIDYDTGAADTPKPDDTPNPQVIAAELQTPGAQAVIQAVRDAAELGQIRRIEALLDEVDDPTLARALHGLLATALREQDSELVLQALDRVAGAS